MFITDEKIADYSFRHTKPESQLLTEIINETHAKCEMPQMLTGRIEGSLLAMLIKISNARNVFEVGTFTGYSALAMAEALHEDGSLVTCEIDAKTAKLAQDNFARSPHGRKIRLVLGPALKAITEVNYLIDLAFIDADKEQIGKYYEALMPKIRPGGLIVIDNALWSGTVLAPQDAESKAIDALNKLIISDSGVENVFLTVRDGVNLVRKK